MWTDAKERVVILKYGVIKCYYIIFCHFFTSFISRSHRAAENKILFFFSFLIVISFVQNRFCFFRTYVTEIMSKAKNDPKRD